KKVFPKLPRQLVTPFQKTLYWVKQQSLCRFFVQICTTLCQLICLKVFEDGAWGRNFFQKVSSPYSV
ncbi:MAG: hypothetical protein IJV76_07215, partial [Clostridia bacterium]|nr:hypothetical protein [Clostridia bacterium]